MEQRTGLKNAKEAKIVSAFLAIFASEERQHHRQ